MPTIKCNNNNSDLGQPDEELNLVNVQCNVKDHHYEIWTCPYVI